MKDRVRPSLLSLHVSAMLRMTILKHQQTTLPAFEVDEPTTIDLEDVARTVYAHYHNMQKHVPAPGGCGARRIYVGSNEALIMSSPFRKGPN